MAISSEQRIALVKIREAVNIEREMPSKLRQEYEEKLARETAQARRHTNELIAASVESDLLSRALVANVAFGNQNRNAVTARIREVSE